MIAAALAAMLWAQPSTALAAPAPDLPIDLRWEAPAGCPSAATVRANVARGLPAMPAGVAPLVASVVVRARDADRWQAALDLRGEDWTATRTLEGASCAAVSDAAGLVIGLALTSELAARPVVVARPPPSPPTAPRLSTPVVSLALGGESGTLPSATTGASLAAGWRWTHARAELRASLFRSRAGTVAAFPDTGGDLSLASLAVRGCALWGWTVSLGPCVLGGVDRVSGSGTGPIATVSVTSDAPFLAAGLALEWRWSRWVAGVLSAEAAIPLVRARFSVENVGLVHEAAAVSLRGALGVELRFR
jgi:hypothetical protein